MPHLPLDALLTGYRDLPAPPKDCGIVRLLVLREPGERRLLPASVRLRPAAGAVGDRWSLDREPEADAEVTVMRADVAGLMAQDGDIARFGDNLFVDMDLSLENLPAGTQVRVGSARCEVTPLPHNGCSKFSARAGIGALKLTCLPDLRAHRLRGIHLRVLEEGEVRVGDAIRVEGRPEIAAAEPQPT